MKHLLSIFALAFLLAGCGTLDPTGAYHSDKVLYSSELITPTAFDLIHTFVTWEQKNRAALAKWPEVTKYADFVRANSWSWFNTANICHDAYLGDKSQVNQDRLQAALRVIQAALIESNQYMIRAATQPK